METHRRGSDGRRFFTTQFKQEQIARIVRQELTLSELARELAVSPSVVRRWQHLSTKGSSAAVASNQEVVPVSELRAAQQRIRDLERALGKKTMEVEILQAARDEVKKDPASTACPSGDGAEDGPDLSDLGDQPRLRLPGERGTPCAVHARAEDRVVTAQIRTVIRTRASYGARRVRALVNRAFETSYNLKRIQRVMNLNGWTLPWATRRRTGRAHRGLIQRAVPNERWCSDVLEIACWNGEIVQVGFALDCHDREVLAHVAAPRDLCAADIQELMQRAVTARFGAGERPDAPIQWLSDNGIVYTALDTIITAERLHLVPITTPVSSPESNGMSEAFVNTLRRDYFAGADLSTAGAVRDQLPAWFADYNTVAPHSTLGYQSPHQYRTTMLAAGPKC